MDDKILRLIYDYSINDKIGDHHFIDKIVEIFISENDLNDYLCGNVIYYDQITSSDDEHKLIAGYDVLTRQIKINSLGFDNRIGDFKEQILKFAPNERCFFINALISHIVLHELQHVAQNKKYNSDLNDTETILCKLGLRDNYLYGDVFKTCDFLRSLGMTDAEIYDLYNKRKALMDTYYKYSPTERMAEIRTHEFLRTLFSKIKDKAPNVHQYEQFQYLSKLNAGYEEISGLGIAPPTFIYIDGTGSQQDFLQFSFYDDVPNVMIDKIYKYPLEDRLTFGLSINYDENSKVKSLINKNNKFN